MAAGFDTGSFRDRTNRVFLTNDGVYRALRGPAVDDWNALAASRLFAQATAAGKLVGTQAARLDDLAEPPGDGPWEALLRHERVPIVSYPYEWCFGMLQDAALLQLELLAAALDEGLTLKDATPYNVQFVGARPVFVDVGSFERLATGRPWTGYRQFCELFLFPLLLQASKNVPFQPLLRGSLDGVSAEVCRQMMSWRDALRRGVLLHVFLQAQLQRRAAGRATDVRGELKAAGFNVELIKANVRGLAKLVGRLRWQQAASTWSDYTTTTSYTQADAQAKLTFVQEAAATRRWNVAWDLGCNTGVFSRVLAQHSAHVVAMDADQLTIERLYRQLRGEDNRQILPLVMNLSDPSPGLGWRGRERTPLATRSKPDVVLALALIHHLSLAANIPLAEIVGWLASLETSLIIEFVAKADPMAERLLANKDDHYDDYNLANFERLLAERFEIVRRRELAGATRVLFFATPRS